MPTPYSLCATGPHEFMAHLTSLQCLDTRDDLLLRRSFMIQIIARMNLSAGLLSQVAALMDHLILQRSKVGAKDTGKVCFRTQFEDNFYPGNSFN